MKKPMTTSSDITGYMKRARAMLTPGHSHMRVAPQTVVILEAIAIREREQGNNVTWQDIARRGFSLVIARELTT